MKIKMYCCNIGSLCAIIFKHKENIYKYYMKKSKSISKFIDDYNKQKIITNENRKVK